MSEVIWMPRKDQVRLEPTTEREAVVIAKATFAYEPFELDAAGYLVSQGNAATAVDKATLATVTFGEWVIEYDEQGKEISRVHRVLSRDSKLEVVSEGSLGPWMINYRFYKITAPGIPEGTYWRIQGFEEGVSRKGREKAKVSNISFLLVPMS